MKPIYTWKIDEFKELNIKFDWDIYINDKNIWMPVFNYAKTWKLFWKITFICDVWRYEILIFNFYYINVFFYETFEAQEWDVSF